MGEVQGRAGAKLIGEIMGKKKVSVITLANDFGKSLAAGFKEASAAYGIEIIGEYDYSIKDREFGPIVSKVKSESPDAIYASGYFFTAGPLVSQLRAAGVDVPPNQAAAANPAAAAHAVWCTRQHSVIRVALAQPFTRLVRLLLRLRLRRQQLHLHIVAYKVSTTRVLNVFELLPHPSTGLTTLSMRKMRFIAGVFGLDSSLNEH